MATHHHVHRRHRGDDLPEGYKAQTAATLVEGLCAMAGIFALYVLFV